MPPMNGISGGLDLALRQGSLIKIKVEEGKVIGYKKLLDWEGGPRSKQSPPVLLGYFQQNMVPHFTNLKSRVVGIDWDPREIFWGSTNRLAAVMKAFSVGYLYNSLLGHQAFPYLIPPKVVRASLGLSGNSHKRKVHAKMLKHLSQPVRIQFLRMSEHQKDAIILAYVALIYNTEFS